MAHLSRVSSPTGFASGVNDDGTLDVACVLLKGVLSKTLVFSCEREHNNRSTTKVAMLHSAVSRALLAGLGDFEAGFRSAFVCHVEGRDVETGRVSRIGGKGGNQDLYYDSTATGEMKICLPIKNMQFSIDKNSTNYKKMLLGESLELLGVFPGTRVEQLLFWPSHDLLKTKPAKTKPSKIRPRPLGDKNLPPWNLATMPGMVSVLSPSALDRVRMHKIPYTLVEGILVDNLDEEAYMGVVLEKHAQGECLVEGVCRDSVRRLLARMLDALICESPHLRASVEANHPELRSFLV